MYRALQSPSRFTKKDGITKPRRDTFAKARKKENSKEQLSKNRP
jgi:hypothetical protein